MPKFVLILMVKNEEKIIQRCLNAVEGVVDAYVITDTGSTDTGTKTTEKDALEMADILSKKDKPVPIIFMKKFVDLYTKNISKDLHKTLLVVASKKESEWTTQEKLDMSILINKVFLPLSTEIGQPK